MAGGFAYLAKAVASLHLQPLMPLYIPSMAILASSLLNTFVYILYKDPSLEMHTEIVGNNLKQRKYTLSDFSGLFEHSIITILWFLDDKT